MAEKFYQRKKTINGVEYTAQFNGLSAALSAVDETYIQNTETTSLKLLSQYIFENVIVEPKGLTADDFETMEELNEVLRFGREVMQGKFRDKKDFSTEKEKG